MNNKVKTLSAIKHKIARFIKTALLPLMLIWHLLLLIFYSLKPDRNSTLSQTIRFFSQHVFSSFIVLLIYSILIYPAYLWVQLPEASELITMADSSHFTVKKSSSGAIKKIASKYNYHISLKNISPYFIQAVIASEDRRFYWSETEHQYYETGPIYKLGRFFISAVKCYGWIKPVNVLTNTKRRCPGGSTISQQLAKMLLVSHYRTPQRKIIELLWAVKMEQQLDKDKILQLYLNRLPLGYNNYGPQTASRFYFGRRVKNLNLYDSVILAAAIQSPVNNWKSKPEKAVARAKIILKRMRQAGFISAAEAVMPAAYRPKQGHLPAFYPYDGHLWYWLKPTVKKILHQQPAGYYELITTLDSEMQLYAERSLEKEIKKTRSVSQGAMLSIRTDGSIVAMVGGAGDISGNSINRVNRPAHQSERPPASTFKPILYLAALEMGFTPDSTISAEKIEIPMPNQKKSYRPKNYNGRYEKKVTLKKALVRSINTAAVRLLYDSVGLTKLISTARKLGISTPELDEASWSLALGAIPVSLQEMTAVYAAFANGGYRITPYGLREIYDVEGNPVWRYKASEKTPQFRPENIKDINFMLTQVVQKGGTGVLAGKGFSAGTVAGKTGTGNKLYDAWFIGYTKELVTGVWIGNDGKKGLTAMKGVSGGTIPAAIWNKYMTLLRKYSQEQLGSLTPLYE